MAAASTGIWNHAAASISLAKAHPMATTNPTTGTSSTSAGDATISANDFLTLLVTEMQNQDPTANTDPNEYINQLVQVNSLEQLININQTLTTALPAPSTTTGRSIAATGAPVAATVHSSSARSGIAAAAPAVHAATQPQQSATTAGNLGVPQASSAAQRVAQALSGRSQ